MSRRGLADADQELYRVAITKKKELRNPDYDWRRAASGPQWIYSDTETRTEFHGPYKSLAAARGQLTIRCTDWEGELRPEIVGVGIHKANIVWEVVE